MTTATNPIAPERFSKGVTILEFINGMQENKDRIEQNYKNASLTNDEIARIQDNNRPINVLVLAEDWCGDVLRYLPVLARMEEVATNWNIRVFYRDKNLDWADRWLKDGQHRAIPVIALFDEDWNELGYYQERPAQVYVEEAKAIADFATLHADLPDAALPYAEMSATTKQLYSPYMIEFRLSRLSDWHRMFVNDILSKLG